MIKYLTDSQIEKRPIGGKIYNCYLGLTYRSERGTNGVKRLGFDSQMRRGIDEEEIKRELEFRFRARLNWWQNSYLTET